MTKWSCEEAYEDDGIARFAIDLDNGCARAVFERDRNGEMSMQVTYGDGDVAKASMTPGQAQALGQRLISLAGVACAAAATRAVMDAIMPPIAVGNSGVKA